MILDDKTLSYQIAADRVGTSLSAVQNAALVLRFGTPEEIAGLSGTASMRGLIALIRERVPKEVRGAMKTPAPRVLTEKARNLRIAAMRAGQQVMDGDNSPYTEIIAGYGIALDELSRALTILRHGTAEQIAMAKVGDLPLSTTCIAIRATVSPEGFKKARKSIKPKTADVRRLLQTDKLLWKTLKSALQAISGMPQPTDVIKFARLGKRSETVDRYLMTAFSWITEFSDEWTKH